MNETAATGVPPVLSVSNETAAQILQNAGWVFPAMGLGLAVVLVVLLRLMLPRAQRRQLRFPVGCLLLTLTMILLGVLLPANLPGHQPLFVGAVLTVLLALGRLTFLLLVEVLLGLKGVEPMPRILKDILQGLVYAAAVLVTLRAAGVEPGSLLTTSALLTAVVGLALQETLGNLVAGLAIQAQRPFDVGDWIQFDQDPRHVGQVMEINWRATTLLTLDRVNVVVPNGPLAKNSITNFSKPHATVRRSIFVMAAHDTPPSQVHEVILKALQDVPGVLTDPAPSVVTHQFKENGIEYWVRFFIDRFDLRDGTDGRVRDRVWYALSRAGISYPLPTQHVHMHRAVAEARDGTHEEQLNVEEQLHRVDFITHLSTQEVQQLATHVQQRLYAPGEVIIHEGEAGSEMFMLLRGEVRVSVRNQEVAQLRAGAFFGEVSLLTGEPRTATVQAITEVVALVLGHHAFRNVLIANPKVAELVSQTVAARQQARVQVQDAHGLEDAAVVHRSHQLLTRIKEFFSLR